ncbi:two-component regulator propeller domain-containing protein [Flavobacterium sp. MMLR14_040]|uniref:hybrid sensor histidine kinase/response regulator transcription factor n=1 Tax=Flavobacterium sp. MMLR14_040 TaxID=3093843 RepID=UPI0029900579|nr:two-component regulator propeller domain-containing protein [Flavobacterium sp. MMLR14_040]MDW8851839.1 two-component regulator propeller domain-containing protein [Flavobacterium sp. MMLR14_040]
MKYFVLHLLFLLGFSSVGFTQDNPIKFLDISDGLSNNSVTTIFQDSDGYLWFGTYDGLNRYDGYNFKVFRNRINDKKSLLFNTIYNIEGDSRKNIWVGGSNGICIYNKTTATFHPVEFTSSNKKNKVLKDIIHQMRSVSDDLVLVASQNLGLIAFENGSFVGKQIPLKVLGNNISINNYDAIAIQDDRKKGRCWIHVRNIGICSYNYKSKSLKVVFPFSKEVKSMKLASDGNLWLGTDEGIFLFNTQSETLSENYFSNKCSVTDILLDKKNEIWISTDGCGIYKIIGTNKKAIPYNAINGVELAKSNSVWSLYEDKAGNKWFGSLRGGISMLSSTPKYFKSIRYNATNPAENFILSFCEDEKKNLWVGTDGAGLKYWNRKNNTYTNYSKKLSSSFITGIVRDTNNEIWLSTWNGGVNKINPKNNSVTQYSCFNPYTKQIEKKIWLVYKDSKANIWASATNEGSLYLFDRPKNTFVLFDKSITNLQSLTETSDGKLWGGNYTSLFSFEKNTRKITKTNIGNPIRCIHEDRDKNLWLGTQEGGLLLFDRKTNTFKRLTTDDGLPSNTILRMLEDKEGNLWMSTYNGVCRFDKKRKTFRNFSVNDGLQSNQFSFNAGLKLSTGEFLFGGINGFNIFFPEAIKGFNQQNNLLLTDFYVNNQPIEESKNDLVSKWESGKIKEVSLPYDQTTLSLEFVALDYNNADKINYAYYLEGWDAQWNYVGQARKANYARLTEGKYTFKVKTTNFKGGWNKEISLVTIEILPPWYRTWWAYTLYLLALAGILFAYLEYHKNKEKLKYKVKIAELESKKEKEVAEKQSSMFTYISHEFRTPLSLIINPLKKAVQKESVQNGSSGSDLAIAHRNARRLLSLVDQLLLFRKAENDADSLRLSNINVNNLCNEVYQCFVNQAKEKNITYKFYIPEHDIEIIGDYEKIEISLFNLMSNAFKYTPIGGEINLKLSENKKEVILEISDSGDGIEKKDIDVIFEKFKQINSKVSVGTGFGIGLYIVKYFVNKHKGTVSCSSEPGKGSTFTLTFLKGNSHFEDIEITDVVATRSQLFDELIIDDSEENKQSLNNTVSESDFQKIMLTDKRTVLIIDDNAEIRAYLIKLFSKNYIVYNAENGEEGLKMTKKQMPDLVISDITMEHMDGLELCRKIKESDSLSHIPVILLTASKNPETHLQGITDGADDYITKPFDDDILVARVESLLRNRSNLRTYFLNSITLRENAQKVPVEYQEILKKCIDIVEANIHKKDFTIKNFALEMGMSHRTLYTKIKIISGQTLNAFIRSLRIRRAAMLMLTEDMNIAQASAEVGFEDPKYFRQQFVKLFGMTPSEYIKKYKNSFNSDLNIIK